MSRILSADDVREVIQEDFIDCVLKVSNPENYDESIIME